ncbi:MAG: hypothetical protein Ct9H90mP3_1570 [Flammeovirgaceae bacterium]|nr:MAG: hypothetical protein Ct9H90mP3_1570 [Flammeovirgaceae bacterium]
MEIEINLRDQNGKKLLLNIVILSFLLLITQEMKMKKDIISDIINGVVDDNYEIEIDRKIAIKMAFQKFKTNSIILVAGKGHEKYQIIGDKSLPHDDKEIIKELIL